MIIGLTGEIASGKTSVAQILIEHGYSAINADQIGHEIQKVGTLAYTQIVEHFGQNILNIDLTIDRKKLGEIVFNNDDQLKVLNQITHKYIFEKIISIIKEYTSKGINNIAIDAALLYKIGLNILVEQVWFVEASTDIKVNRIIIRDNVSKEQAIHRLTSQQKVAGMKESKEGADLVIINDGSLEDLRKKVLKIL